MWLKVVHLRGAPLCRRKEACLARGTHNYDITGLKLKHREQNKSECFIFNVYSNVSVCLLFCFSVFIDDDDSTAFENFYSMLLG